MTRRYPAALLLASTLLCAGAHAQTLHPVKLSKAELAGPVFQRPGAVKESKDGNRTSDFTSYTSPDKVFQTGVYQSEPVCEEIREAPGTPYTEFLYFLSGGVKLTSSDGTVMQVRSGEAVTLPKGWTGGCMNRAAIPSSMPCTIPARPSRRNEPRAGVRTAG
ncbi:MAG: cupin domain-containing protein [Burkholderia sp.]